MNNSCNQAFANHVLNINTLTVGDDTNLVTCSGSRQLEKLEAIQFVVAQGGGSSEWQEAALYSLLCWIATGKVTNLTEQHLVQLVEDVLNI